MRVARRCYTKVAEDNNVSYVTNVNPGNEARDEYPATEYLNEAEEYRGSHRRTGGDDVYDEHEADPEYEEYEEYAAAPAGGSTAAAAGGIPKRGLAMILIAVAAILLLWGLYALTQNDNTGSNAAGSQAGVNAEQEQGQAPNQQQDPQNPQGQQPAPGASQSPAPGQPPAPNQNPNQNPNENPNENQGQAPNQQQAPQGQPAPGQQPAPNQGPALTKENAQVYIYNNSPNAGLAGDTADKLAPQYTVLNRSADNTDMNLPEQRYGIFPRTTVFYDPSVTGAEQVAAELAREVNGVPTPINDVPQGATLPDEVRGKREAISVVLTG